MTRLYNQERAGFYPTPAPITDLIRSYMFAPDGGRICDPCAGDGRPLITLAQELGLDAYGVELNETRYHSAKQSYEQELGAVNGRLLLGHYNGVKSGHNTFNLIYCNPPYDLANDEHDERKTRAEYLWLRNTRPWLQPNGVMVWVVPTHMLKYAKAVRYLCSWFYDIEIRRFPGESYDRFKQVIVFAKRNKHSRGYDAERGQWIREHVDDEGVFVGHSLTYQTAPRYILPKPTTFREGITWRPNFVDSQTGVNEVMRYGLLPQIKTALHPPDLAQELTTLMPMRLGHMLGVIGAGFINNQVLQKGSERILIKGNSYKEWSRKSQTQSTPEQTTTKDFHTQKSTVGIMTLNGSGKVTELAGEALQRFLDQWLDELIQLVADMYPPKYAMDAGLNGYAPILSQLNQTRVIPRVGKRGLLPAQMHAAAAVATHLETDEGAILNGAMGTGKTLMGVAIFAVQHHKNRKKNSHAIVLCPPHLVKKWLREVKLVWPDCQAMALKTISDVDQFFARKGPIIGVMKETSARAGSGWFHSYSSPFGNFVHTSTQRPFERDNRPSMQFNEFGQATLDSSIEARISTLINTHQLSPEALLEQKAQRGLICPTCGETLVNKGDGSHLKQGDFLKSVKLSCHACHTPLWQDGTAYTSTPRYPLATYIKKRYKNKLHLLLADEAHEYKSKDSDRGYAFHRLSVAAKKVVAMTGTLYGGKASTLFWILYRISSNFRERFTRNEKQLLAEWVETYGILQEIETTRTTHGKSSGNSKNSKAIRELPSAYPPILRWVLDKTVFISLADMGMALPEYEEIPNTIPMTAEMDANYHRLKRQMMNEMAPRLLAGDKSLLGAYLQTLITWPDTPWKTRQATMKDGTVFGTAEAINAPMGSFPKEEAILQTILDNQAEGRGCLLLCQQTNTLDIQPQWKAFLESHGLKVAILKAPPDKREAWINKQVKDGVNVIISHPRKVQTGLDLLAYPSIIWMGTEYSLYTIMQANKRAFRIGQEKNCRVYYFTYEDTLQMDALRLIASKMKAAGRVNGELDTGEALDEFDDTMSGDIMSALKSMLEQELNTEAIAKEINREWDEIRNGRLALSNSQHFHECTSRDDAKTHYRELMRQYHPDARVGQSDERTAVTDISTMFAEANTAFMEKEGFAGDYTMQEPEVSQGKAEEVPLDESLEALHEAYEDAKRGLIIPKAGNAFHFAGCRTPLDIELRYTKLMEEHYPEVLAEMKRTDEPVKTETHRPVFGGGWEKKEPTAVHKNTRKKSYSTTALTEKGQHQLRPSFWPDISGWVSYIKAHEITFKQQPEQRQPTIDMLRLVKDEYIEVEERDSKHDDYYKQLMVVSGWLKHFEGLATKLKDRGETAVPPPSPPPTKKERITAVLDEAIQAVDEQTAVTITHKSPSVIIKKWRRALLKDKKKVTALFEHEGVQYVMAEVEEVSEATTAVAYRAVDFYNSPKLPFSWEAKQKLRQKMGQLHGELVRVGRKKEPYTLVGPTVTMTVNQPVQEKVEPQVVRVDDTPLEPKPIGGKWVFGVHTPNGNLRPANERDNVATQQLGLFG